MPDGIRNEKLYAIALQSALDSHLSDQPRDKTPQEILEMIDACGDVEPNMVFEYNETGVDVLVWSKFEYESGTGLAELISDEADSLMQTFYSVAEEIKAYLVELAVEDKFPLDLNELQLGMWVKYGLRQGEEEDANSSEA